MAARSAAINVMMRAADRAARGLKRDFGEVTNLQVSRKGPADFVSAADLRAEKILREELRKARPDYGLLMEESGAAVGKDSSGRRWIVDPLDGTTNFLHGLPHFAISVALEERGEVIAGLVYDPIKDERFFAERGSGAYLNDRRIRVSGRRGLPESLVATGIPFMGHGDRGLFKAELEEFMRETAGVRRWGAASLDLAYVAAGRFEGFWETKLNAWDIAAGSLLVREAGGYVSDTRGRPLQLEEGTILAASDALHGSFVSLLKAAREGHAAGAAASA